MNSARNSENYRIFSPNPIADGIEAQPYSDRFPQHHIPFFYRLPYLPNNMKMIKKYEKAEPVFSKILLTVFTLTKTTGDRRHWFSPLLQIPLPNQWNLGSLWFISLMSRSKIWSHQLVSNTKSLVK
jgi:hypothetical protein